MVDIIRKIGVIGAGQMGNGIAHVCALAGFDVVLNDIAAGRMSRRHRHHQRQSGASGRRAAHQRRASARRRSGASRPADTLDDLGDCDLVIEAATEKEEVKRKIFAALCPALEAGRHRRHQHLVDLDHAARRRRPTGRSASSAFTS